MGVRDYSDKFQVSALSFDLSLTPSVVGALPPAVSASLQLTCFALCPLEGSRPPNPSSQATVLNERQRLGQDKSVSITA